MTTLADVLNRYIQDHPYGMSPAAAAQLRWSVSGFGKYLKRDPQLADLVPDTFNGYLDHLTATRRPATCRSHRGNLLTIWRFAFDQALTETPPLRIRRLRPIRHAPEAWQQFEILELFAAADRLPGFIRGLAIPRAAYWGSLLRFAYDTAIRLGDLLRLTWSDLDRGRIIQAKTGQPVAFRVRASTQAALRALPRESSTAVVWPLWGRRPAFYRAFNGLVASAGIRPGTFRWIRRAAVTQVERIAPGAGTRLAGHSCRATTEAFYIDRDQLDPAPLPPLDVEGPWRQPGPQLAAESI